VFERTRNGCIRQRANIGDGTGSTGRCSGCAGGGDRVGRVSPRGRGLVRDQRWPPARRRSRRAKAEVQTTGSAGQPTYGNPVMVTRPPVGTLKSGAATQLIAGQQRPAGQQGPTATLQLASHAAGRPIPTPTLRLDRPSQYQPQRWSWRGSPTPQPTATLELARHPNTNCNVGVGIGPATQTPNRNVGVARTHTPTPTATLELAVAVDTWSPADLDRGGPPVPTPVSVSGLANLPGQLQRCSWHARDNATSELEGVD